MNAQRAAMLARLERYAALRHAGLYPADAAREIPVADWGRYERWYRRERLRLPGRPQGWGDGLRLEFRGP